MMLVFDIYHRASLAPPISPPFNRRPSVVFSSFCYFNETRMYRFHFVILQFALIAFVASAAELDLHHLDLSSLNSFQVDIADTLKAKINSLRSHDSVEWLSNTINDDLETLMNAANITMTNRYRIYDEMLNQSPASADHIDNIESLLEDVIAQTSNEIAAEILKTHRVLFQHQSNMASNVNLPINEFRKHSVVRAAYVMKGVQSSLTNLLATIKVCAGSAINTIENEIKAAIEGRPMGMFMQQGLPIMEVMPLQPSGDDNNVGKKTPPLPLGGR